VFGGRLFVVLSGSFTPAEIAKETQQLKKRRRLMFARQVWWQVR
jgi:hypothetical protein